MEPPSALCAKPTISAARRFDAMVTPETMRVSMAIITRLTTRSLARDAPSSTTFHLGYRESCAELRRLQPTRFSTEALRGPVRPVVPPHHGRKAIAHASELIVSSRSHLPVRIVRRRETAHQARSTSTNTIRWTRALCEPLKYT